MHANTYFRMYVVPHGGECSRFSGDIVMLLNTIQQFLLHASREILSEGERQSAEHEFGEEHENHQTEILKITR